MKERKIYAIEESGNGGSPSPSPTLEPNKTVTVKWDDYDYDETEVETEVTPSTGYDGMEKVTVTTKFARLQSTKSVSVNWDQSAYSTIYPTEGFDAMEKTRVTVTQPTVITPQVTYTTNGDNYIFPEDYNVDFLSGAVVKVNVPSQPSQQVHPLAIIANQTSWEIRLTFTDSTPDQTISFLSSVQTDTTKVWYGIVDNVSTITVYNSGTYQRSVRALYIPYSDLTPTSIRQSPTGAQVRTVMSQGEESSIPVPVTVTVSGISYTLCALLGGSM